MQGAASVRSAVVRQRSKRVRRDIRNDQEVPVPNRAAARPAARIYPRQSNVQEEE